MTYYYLYKVTNWFNGKIYVGVHKTSDMNDGYMGSGKVLKRAIQKYGLEYFTKEILQVFETQEEMFGAEAQVVNENFIKDSMTYNLKLGGEGGFDYIVLLKRNSLGSKKGGLRTLELHRSLIEENLTSGRSKRWNGERISTFLNKNHSEESKKRIGEANSVHQSGEKNSQFGTCWVCLKNVPDSAKKIRKEDLETWLDLGWSRGRK